MAGVPPKRGEIFHWETELTSQANTNIFQVNPTIAAGDVIVYQDGVLDGNIDTTPTPIGASKTVACQLSAAEMTADRIKVVFSDAVGAEWQDQSWEFFTVTTPFDELIAAIWSHATRTLTSFGTLAADVWDRFTALLTTAGSIGRLLVDYLNVAVSTRTTLGAGAITFTYTLTSTVDGSPIADADVWATTDLSGSNVVANGRTNSSGVITFYLDAATYYLWRQKDGWNFDNPDTEVVS